MSGFVINVICKKPVVHSGPSRLSMNKAGKGKPGQWFKQRKINPGTAHKNTLPYRDCPVSGNVGRM